MKQLPFKGKLLVCDMDGTLLNSNDQISTENIAALERFVEGGGLFTVATGRTARGASRHIRNLPVNVPVIVINGAQIFDFENQKILWESCLEKDIDNILRDLILNFPELGIEVFFKDGVSIIWNNDETEKHRRREAILPDVLEMAQVPKPWYKIVLAWENERLKKVESFLHGRTGSSRTVFSEEVFLDLINKNTSKGSALEVLMHMAGVQNSNVITIGDNLNDLEMIQTAGIGVAVENAHDDLKKHATFCTCINDDHAVAKVVKWIEENI